MTTVSSMVTQSTNKLLFDKLAGALQKADILFKEKAMMTILMNFADIDNETDRKQFVNHVLNLESINMEKL